MTAKEIVLVINPGSSSTKLAVYSRDGELTAINIAGKTPKFAELLTHFNQYIKDSSVKAVVGRGGLLKPLPGGTYSVNRQMMEDLKAGKYGNHASNQGALLASEFASHFDVPAFIVDPVTSDEFPAVARLSGVPGIERTCRGHALNIRAVARRACADLSVSLENSNFVVAHLGGGISVAALKNGKIIDVNDALLGAGPFSPQRAGTLPIRKLLDLAYSNKRSDVEKLLSRNSGFVGYLGTDDMKIIENRINAGENEARQIVDAMIYQVAKECSAMAMAFKAHPDAIVLTGGLAYSEYITSGLIPRIEKISTVLVYPGGFEMEALAKGAWRIVDGEESVKEYL